jgi:hypothetical protein
MAAFEFQSFWSVSYYIVNYLVIGVFVPWVARHFITQEIWAIFVEFGLNWLIVVLMDYVSLFFVRRYLCGPHISNWR